MPFTVTAARPPLAAMPLVLRGHHGPLCLLLPFSSVWACVVTSPQAGATAAAHGAVDEVSAVAMAQAMRAAGLRMTIPKLLPDSCLLGHISVTLLISGRALRDDHEQPQ
jgi:hypothetical protein